MAQTSSQFPRRHSGKDSIEESELLSYIDDTGFNNGVYTPVDLSAGTFGTTVVSGTGWTLNSKSIVADANGFYKLTFNVTSDASTGLAIVLYNGTTTFTGTGTNGIILTHASLTQP